jgi:hypothetical protein
MSPTLGSGLRLAKEFSHLRAVEQAQQSLECAAVAWGGVELEGKPASIKSSSESIQSSNALSLLQPLGFVLQQLDFALELLRSLL